MKLCAPVNGKTIDAEESFVIATGREYVPEDDGFSELLAPLEVIGRKPEPSKRKFLITQFPPKIIEVSFINICNFVPQLGRCNPYQEELTVTLSASHGVPLLGVHPLLFPLSRLLITGC